MKLQEVIDNIVFSEPWQWNHIHHTNVDPEPFCLRVGAFGGGDRDTSTVYAPAAHTDYAVLTTDVGITLAWGMVAGGDYHEPWTRRCPNPSAWTGYFDVGYHGNLLHRDVYVSVDGDRCYLPLPRNLDDLRVAADYARVTALLSALSLDAGDSEFRVYVRRTGLVLADQQWPRR